MTAVTTSLGGGLPAYPTTRRPPSRAAIARARRATPAVYWRRRLAVAGLALGLVVVAAQAGDALGGVPLATPERRPAATGGAGAGAAGAAAPAEPTWVEIVVRPGDSPWSIVERAFPGADPRPRVDRVVEARRGAPLLPGEVVRVPR